MKLFKTSLGLPDQTGHGGQFLTTDGLTAIWAAILTTGSVSGAAKQVGFFFDPSTVIGDNDFEWDNAAKTLTINGEIDIPNNNPIIWPSTNYSGATSFQNLQPDLNVGPGVGVNGPSTAFIASIMGNLIASNLTKTGNYLGAGIFHYNISGTNATTYPSGSVLAGIGDTSLTAKGAVIAYIDGDSGPTNAEAAFKVMNNNSTPASGFDFGLDLQDAAHDGYLPVDSAFYKKAELRLTEDVCVLLNSGAPTDGALGTGAGVTGTGSLVVDFTNGSAYINTGSKVSPAWKKLEEGSLAGFTPGSVIFADALGDLSEDNANFFYDSILKKLTVTGTIDPTDVLFTGNASAVTTKNQIGNDGSGHFFVQSATGTSFGRDINITGGRALTPLGVGGNINIAGGQGGDGDITFPGGNGATVTVSGGAPGADGGGGQGGYGLLIFQNASNMQFKLQQNGNNVVQILDGSDSMIEMDTAIGSAEIRFGNAVTNPVFNFNGTGKATFGGDVEVTGKLTVIGAIDPTSVSIDAGIAADAFLNLADGQNAALSASDEGRLIYNKANQRFEFSENGGAFNSIGSDINPLSSEIYVDGGQSPVSPNGSIASPFITIQDALDFIATQAQGSNWVVHITNGFYTENLTIPATYQISLSAIFFAVLIGNIAWTDSSGGNPFLQLRNVDISGDITISDGGQPTGFNLYILQNSSIDSGLGGKIDASAAITGTNVMQLINVGSASVDPVINAPAFTAYLQGCSIANSDATPSLLKSANFSGGNYYGSLTVTDVPAVGMSGVIWHDAIDLSNPVFTGIAGSFKADGVSSKSFFESGGTFAGSATLVSLEENLVTVTQGQMRANFSTLQAAIDYVLTLTPGAYQFNLTPAIYGDISFDASGFVFYFVAEGAAAVGNITWTSNSNFSNLFFHNIFWTSLTVSDTGGSPALRLSALIDKTETFFGNASGPIDASGISGLLQLDLTGTIEIAGDPAITGNINVVASNGVIISNATSTPSVVNKFTATVSTILGSITVSDAGNLISNLWQIAGDFSTPVFTGPALSFVSDNLNHSSFIAAGGAFAGGATYVPLEGILGDTTIDGKLTVTGTIDPTDIIFSGSNTEDFTKYHIGIDGAGIFFFNAANAPAASNLAGSEMDLFSGSGDGSGDGALLNIQAGDGGSTGDGGEIGIFSGNTTAGKSGDVLIQTGVTPPGATGSGKIHLETAQMQADGITAGEIELITGAGGTGTGILAGGDSGSILFDGGLGGADGGAGAGKIGPIDIGSINKSALRSFGRFQMSEGGGIGSANDLTLGLDGNFWTITAAVQINRIASAQWQSGSIVYLKFSGTPTVKHNQASGGGFNKILVDGNTDYIATAGSIVQLFFDGTNWYLHPYYTA